MQKALKYLSFGTLAVLILTMMAATVLHYDVYYNPVFIALWGVVAVSGLAYVVIRGVPRKLPVFGLHLAFVLILAGALITHIWGESGMLHLRQGDRENPKPSLRTKTELENSFRFQFHWSVLRLCAIQALPLPPTTVQ